MRTEPGVIESEVSADLTPALSNAGHTAVGVIVCGVLITLFALMAWDVVRRRRRQKK